MFKVFKDGKLPTKGSKYSAAVDLYAREDVVVGAGETVLVPLGVCIDLDSRNLKNAILDYGNVINMDRDDDKVQQPSQSMGYDGKPYVAPHF